MSLSAPPSDEKPIDRLIAIMARLRDQQTGCAWDLEQNFATNVMALYHLARQVTP